MKTLAVQLPGELWKRLETASGGESSRVALRAAGARIMARAFGRRRSAWRDLIEANAFDWLRFLRDPANRWELHTYLTADHGLSPGMTLVCDTQRKLVWVHAGAGGRASGRPHLRA